ncbi:hypothetical protein AGOR_G00232970 [Albula goreensis]|uniref:Dentin sialophosphoprotein-like n=1 Tax=Albula goreensis TaxID=1534307 RepID=A0A8T3CEY9_9TELE|nr:hypothetical protein AGOR_G00232970 [Albula goreensis]
MKLTVLICLLGAAFSSPIFQRDILDETVAETGLDVNNTFNEDHVSENQTLEREILDGFVSQPNTIVQRDVLDDIAPLTATVPMSTATNNVTEIQTQTQTPSSDESDSEPDSSPENTSEDTTSESIETTSEDKTSEETENNYVEMTDPDGNGDMRDDSRGSEENTRRHWLQVFNINLKSEEDSVASQDTSEQTSEEDSQDSDSESQASDSMESVESQESPESQGQSQSQECTDAVTDTDCDSTDRSISLRDDGHVPSQDLLNPDDNQVENHLW